MPFLHDNDTPPEPQRRRVDYVFGPALVPASEWYYAQPLFVVERDRYGHRVGLESYEERVKRGEVAA